VTAVKEALGLCRTVAAEAGVSLRVKTRPAAAAGLAQKIGRGWRVTLNVQGLTPEEILSAFFHELAHVDCYRRGVYPAFHLRRGARAFHRAVVLHGLQAERYVDALGRRLMAAWVPGGACRYKPGYRRASEVLTFKVLFVLPSYRALVKAGELGRAA